MMLFANLIISISSSCRHNAGFCVNIELLARMRRMRGLCIGRYTQTKQSIADAVLESHGIVLLVYCW